MNDKTKEIEHPGWSSADGSQKAPQSRTRLKIQDDLCLAYGILCDARVPSVADTRGPGMTSPPLFQP